MAVLGGVAPADVALVPRHAEHLGSDAVDVHHRLGPQIADSRLEADAAIGHDEKEPVEADRAADVTANRYADAAHLRADLLRAARDAFLPVELFRATVERFLNKCAGGNEAACRSSAGPNSALPSGQLMRRMAT
jgi:hypothetical protein